MGGAEHLKLRKYWLEQVKTGRGPGVVFYKGSRFQKGHGLASILGSIGGIIKSPIVRRGLAYAAKTALNTGGDVISNLASGQDFKTAAKGGLSRQKHIQKMKAVNTIKKMVNPHPPRRRMKKSLKRIKRAHQRTDNYGSLRR